MAGVQIKVHKAGVAKLLKDGDNVAQLPQRAGRIMAAFGPGLRMERDGGAKRARVAVITATHEARLREARERALTRAIDAGRG